ncbi:MAG TPA: biotin--[acetyl-CoA-carboxylase] ligase [Planctomycetota bacterium]|jgi:BirA family biotin operon repressor/biotin-[acetyl-CoA-carboxylase] ligase|nr:biotin--[acetyl-CoA-carboxylase] ligase [Planctomycetota bacterium]
MKLAAESIRSRLHTRIVGKTLRCVDVCASTNDLAWKEALSGAPDGTAVFAEEQTLGRGRFGRTWVASRGKAVLTSVVLRPEIEADRVPLVTVAAALAAAEVVGDEARIRFPNDVMLGERKIAGILVEARFISSRPDVFIVGIGLNVNAHPSDMNATSLGPDVSRVEVARSLLEALDGWYGRLGGPLREFRRAWRDRSFILGRRVRVRQNGRSFTGVVEESDPIDGLVLRLDSGHPCTVRSEHVEHLEVL